MKLQYEDQQKIGNLKAQMTAVQRQFSRV